MASPLRKIFRIFVKILLAILILIAAAIIYGLWASPVKEAKTFGITFASPFAQKFGMDAHEVYLALLDDLKVKKVRLPVYWDKIEANKDEYNFDDLDWQVTQAGDRGAKVILTIGRKLPRWPECHQPRWVLEKKDIDYEHDRLLKFMEITVKRYKDNKALFAWQVENEPFLPFGDNCPLFDSEFLDKEIALVKSLDTNHPIIITDSGELSIWIRAAKRADIFGSTMYRQIWNENLGFFTYPLPPQFFRVKLSLMKLFTGERPVIVSELQAEPWGPHQLYEENLFPLESQYEQLSVARFKEYISYAKRSGFDEFYLWGVEWWYFQKTHRNEPGYWEEAKKLMQ